MQTEIVNKIDNKFLRPYMIRKRNLVKSISVSATISGDRCTSVFRLLNFSSGLGKPILRRSTQNVKSLLIFCVDPKAWNIQKKLCGWLCGLECLGNFYFIVFKFTLSFRHSWKKVFMIWEKPKMVIFLLITLQKQCGWGILV